MKASLFYRICFCLAHSFRGRAHPGLPSGRSPLGSGFPDSAVALDTLRRPGIQSELLGFLYWIRVLRDYPFVFCGHRFLATGKFAEGVTVDHIAYYMGVGDLLHCSDVFELPIFFYDASRIFWRDRRLPHSRSVACG
jgi:hypothetical protein